MKRRASEREVESKRLKDDDAPAFPPPAPNTTFSILPDDMLYLLFEWFPLRPRLLALSPVNKRFRRIALDSLRTLAVQDARAFSILSNLTSLTVLCPFENIENVQVRLPRLKKLLFDCYPNSSCTCHLLSHLTGLTSIDFRSPFCQTYADRERPSLSIVKNNAPWLQGLGVTSEGDDCAATIRLCLMLQDIPFPQLTRLLMPNNHLPIVRETTRRYSHQLEDATLRPVHWKLPSLPNLKSVSWGETRDVLEPRHFQRLLEAAPQLTSIDLLIATVFDAPLIHASSLTSLEISYLIDEDDPLIDACSGICPKLTSLSADAAFYTALAHLLPERRGGLSLLTALRATTAVPFGAFPPNALRLIAQCTSLRSLSLELPAKTLKLRDFSFPFLDEFELHNNSLSTPCTFAVFSRIISQILALSPRLRRIEFRSLFIPPKGPKNEEALLKLLKEVEARGVFLLELSLMSVADVPVMERISKQLLWLKVVMRQEWLCAKHQHLADEHADEDFPA